MDHSDMGIGLALDQMPAYTAAYASVTDNQDFLNDLSIILYRTDVKLKNQFKVTAAGKQNE